MAYIFNAPGVAQDAMYAASSLISRAQAQASSVIDVSSVNVNFSPAKITFSNVNGPSQFVGDFVEPTFSEDVALRDIVIPEVVTLPDAPAELSLSELFQTSKPTFDISDAGLEQPSLATPSLPAEPNVNLPSYDGDSSDSLTAPTITTPSFDANFDGQDPGTLADQDIQGDFRSFSPELLANMESFSDSMLTKWCPEYSSAMATLETKIAAGLNGGTAIDDSIEQQIYQRSTSRAANEKYGIDRQAEDGFSRKGFAIPPGMLKALRDKAQADYSRIVSIAASEVAIERAKIELNHLQFLMGLTADMRKAMVQAIVQAQGNALQCFSVALDIGRSAAEIAIRVHNANVEIYRAKREYYQAQAEVYRTKLEAAFAELRSFEAQIEAEKLKSEVDRNRIEIYQAKIAAEETKVRLYVARLDGVRQIAEMERNKIALYEARVRAFAARIQGKEAEFGAYKASIEGDIGRIEAYGKQVDAYRARVESVKAVNESNKVNADITAEYNKNLVELFDSKVRKYIAQLEASGRVFNSKLDAYRAGIDAYRADIEKSRAEADVSLQNTRINLDRALKQSDIDTEINVAAARLKESANETSAQMAMHGASAHASMASSAFGSVNLSYSESLQL